MQQEVCSLGQSVVDWGASTAPPLYRGCSPGHLTTTRLAPDWLRDQYCIDHHGVHMGQQGGLHLTETSLNHMTTWGI